MKYVWDYIREDQERIAKEENLKGRQSGLLDGKRIGKLEGIRKGKREGKLEYKSYNIPIDVDTIKEGYPILCA